MKNQYVGDVNDYLKYGLLRAIDQTISPNLLIAWMLTPDDESQDGKFISYLEQPNKWLHHDPELFVKIRGVFSSNLARNVGQIESADILPRAIYFSTSVPDDKSGRERWFGSLIEHSKASDFVFLDPDNGLEVKSRPCGVKNSSKYLYLHEVEGLWAAGKSLLIYQHFIREKRVDFIERMLKTLRGRTPGSVVTAFSTSRVIFLMALQPKYQESNREIASKVIDNWSGKINCHESFSN